MGTHPAREAVAPDVLTADLQGPVGPLPQEHPGLGGVGRHRQADAAASGAQVQHTALPQGLYIGDGLLRQHLRVRSGDQHLRRDVQGQAVKLPLPDEVGHRLPLQVARHQLPGPPLQLRRGVQRPVPIELPSRLLPVAKHTSSRASKVAASMPAARSCWRISKNKSLYVIAILRSVISFLPIPGIYQASLPFSEGSTSSKERMAHSIIPSSGSLVVKFCIHIPGAVSSRLRPLSWRPTQRLNS